MQLEYRTVLSMAAMRFLAGAIEITAALLMLRLAKVQAAMKINAVLGMIGPTVLMIVSSLGLIGLSQQISYARMLIIAAGVLLIFYGTRS
ncbi:MAG TPA: YqhV family protein [Firmicutes bacterium]|nr:YqhV family protein [Bacillota bacterium]